MVARVGTVAFQGIEVVEVDVQVRVGGGLPNFLVVGLPDKAVAESRERVRGALEAIGLALPSERIVVNLAPADLLKEGSHYDLPIALALMAAVGVLPLDEAAGLVALGELSLDGRLSPVAGVLPAALHAAATGRALVVPKAQGPEAAWAEGLEVLAPDSLIGLVNHLKGDQLLSAPKPRVAEPAGGHQPDLRDIKGQENAKRALELAAAGGHNLLMLWYIYSLRPHGRCARSPTLRSNGEKSGYRGDEERRNLIDGRRRGRKHEYDWHPCCAIGSHVRNLRYQEAQAFLCRGTEGPGSLLDAGRSQIHPVQYA